MAGTVNQALNGEVPEGIRRARLAFLRDFSILIGSVKTRGKFVCYRHDQLVAVANDYRSMIDVVIAHDIPEDEYLIIEVAPGADRGQRLYAEEAEIDPD